MPVHKLYDMPEKLLWQYQMYGQEHGFPSRRLEIYAAQIAWITALVAGNKTLKLQDFMFDKREPEELDPEALLIELNFNPRN